MIDPPNRPSRTAVASLAFRALDQHVIHGGADELAFAGVGRPMTYAQLLHDSASVASALREIGVTVGTGLAIELPPTRELVIVVLAGVRLGAELDTTADLTVSGEPPVLRTPDTEVPWDVLVRAGRADPVPAPAEDPEGYQQRWEATPHHRVLATLLAGGTLT